MSQPDVPTTSTQIQLVSRPVGWPTAANFTTVTVELPDLAPGEVRVVNEHISVDPYMRGRMNDTKSYTPPFALGETMTGGALGRVVASADPERPVGALVLHGLGWRDVAQGPGAQFSVVPELDGVSSTAYLGVLGGTGLTAWVGLHTIARLQPGEVVFVSGAAGAVGSIAGQIARMSGAKAVIGSAGGPEKVALLTERYGFDAAFDYKAGPAADQLRSALERVGADGVDVYFDNVGGEQLEAAIGAMNMYGRAALCGAISSYNASEPAPGPRNLQRLVMMKLTLQGFIVSDHQADRPAFGEQLSGWLRSGEVRWDETIVDGLDHAVDAFLGMLRGANTGKMLVRTS